MKIILNQDVQNLGEEGDVREVARGYARNYLIPKGLGVAYTKQNLALLAGKRKAIEKRKDEKRDHAAGMKERIEALDLQIAMTVGETGRLFGSVTNTMLAEELAKLGIEVERKKIEIPEHTIKMTGKFVVKVKLYGTEIASLKVTVTGPKGAEATAAAEAPAEAAVEPASEAKAAAEAEAAAEPASEAKAEAEAEAVAEAGAEPATEPESSEPAEAEATAEAAAEAEIPEETPGEVSEASGAEEQDSEEEDDAEATVASDDEESTQRE